MARKRVFILLLGMFLLGLFLRVYNVAEYFGYSHDNDLAGWIIKDIVANKHPRLIGQETSNQGVFIGPLFYYMLIPFYLIFNMDPIGGTYMVALLGLFSIFSYYYCFKEIFNLKAGLVAAFIYTVSFYTVFGDREVVPTMPIFLWSVWFFYSLNLILKGNQKIGFLFSAVLMGLVWHINSGLAIFAPLIILAWILSKEKLVAKYVLSSVGLLIVLISPFLLFEYKHGFIQTRSVFSSFGVTKDIISGVDKVERVLRLSSKNLANLFTGDLPHTEYAFIFTIAILIFIFLYVKKILPKNHAILILSWLSLIVIFFSKISIVLSEYYLNSAIVIWIGLASLFISYLMDHPDNRKYAVSLLVIFTAINIYRFVTYPVNRSGYVERKQIVKAIKEDMIIHGYPCVAISYIVNPGYDLGYRYFFYLENMHVNRPSSNSPVYTVVFPLKPIFQEDKSFGALGLIYPDYNRYTKEGVRESCSGANSNLTDPMFGYVE